MVKTKMYNIFCPQYGTPEELKKLKSVKKHTYDCWEYLGKKCTVENGNRCLIIKTINK